MESRGTRDRSTLVPHRFTAQEGEDILIYDFFKNDKPGFFVEAGAYDGVTFSNTYLLESLGWRGLLVETHPEMAGKCKANRTNSVVVHAALGPAGCSGEVEFTCADDPVGGAALSFLEADKSHIERCLREECMLRKVRVPIRTLDSLLESLSQRVQPHSLDVEGFELEVLKGFDLDRFKPKLIIIELHGDERDERVAAHLAEQGYFAVAEKGCNRFYVPAHLRVSFATLLMRP